MYSYQERLQIEKLCSESEIFDKYVNMMKEKNDILLSHMTHEIGNPLALISGTIQLMDRKYKELADIKYWNQLKEDIEELTKLLKSYSVYNNCSKLNASETNLLELIHSVINATVAMREEKKIKMFVNDVQEPMPCLELYSCDDVKIRQVFMNVMKNALEAVEKGGYIRVEIPQEVERVVEDGRKKGFLRFTIANSVENVDAVDLDNVFELYVSSKSIARGLGMPIAYRVMEGHRGNIEFDVVGNEVRCHLLFPTI